MNFPQLIGRIVQICVIKIYQNLSNDVSNHAIQLGVRALHIVFVHGLGQKTGAWGLLRDLVASNLGAEQSECVYDASIFTKSSPERAARQLATHVDIATGDDPEVVIVAYSLGGLIARQMLTMILTNEIENAQIADRVRGVVTLGTPLDGAKTQRAIRLVRSLKWLKFIGDQNTNERIPFRQASRGKKDNEVATFYHYQFERDFWVLDQSPDNYTEFDNPAGTFPGTHTDFLSDDDLARKVSNGLVSTIRKLMAYGQKFGSPDSPEKQVIAPPLEDEPQSAETEFTSIILISCSNSKEGEGANIFAPPKPGEWLSDRRLREQLLEKRATILDKLKAHQIVDQKFSQGNRGDRKQNIKLIRGPDFGFQSDEGEYLPAIGRYAGRLYTPSRDVDWEEFHARDKRPLILIMSALYGFVQSNESIQNYDAGISDIDLTSGTPLKGIWTDWMTDALNCVVSQIDGKVKIFNLMADLDYTSAIRWSSLKREKCSVYHLASDKFSDIELLPIAGIVFGGLIRSQDLLGKIHRTSVDESHVLAISKFGEASGPYAGSHVAFARTEGELSSDFDWREAISKS